ncbi:hypothetical protein M3182_00735 [Mesobacillus maritimus]|uniref:hypothetical protein n=1 Tax=Mesobacillus maritimus TaxID=1643336 RepID=UPI0020403B78|nr:hypothetical protein [Mesobacillus maritimus]MCM3584265.1 hypothetical protein [Mesobacillus maritimus]
MLKKIGLWIFAIIIPVLLNYLLFSWSAPKVNGSLNSWMGFLGNYSGGIIGALVAIMAARLQIEAHKKEISTQRKVQQLPTLIKIKNEIEILEENLNKLKKMGDEKNMQQPSQEAKEVQKHLLIQGMIMEPRYQELSLFIKKLREDTWTSIEKISSVNLQELIIQNYQTHSKIIDVLYTDLIRSEIRIEEVEKIIDELKAKEDKSISEIEQLRHYQKESTELLWIINFNLNERHKIWDDLYVNNFYKESVRSIKKLINDEISIIRKIIGE